MEEKKVKQEFVEKRERMFEWLHTQVGSFDITSSRINKQYVFILNITSTTQILIIYSTVYLKYNTSLVHVIGIIWLCCFATFHKTSLSKNCHAALNNLVL